MVRLNFETTADQKNNFSEQPLRVWTENWSVNPLRSNSLLKPLLPFLQAFNNHNQESKQSPPRHNLRAGFRGKTHKGVTKGAIKEKFAGPSTRPSRSVIKWQKFRKAPNCVNNRIYPNLKKARPQDAPTKGPPIEASERSGQRLDVADARNELT